MPMHHNDQYGLIPPKIAIVALLVVISTYLIAFKAHLTGGNSLLGTKNLANYPRACNMMDLR